MTEAFVWVWLPKRGTPVVAGRVFAHDDRVLFNYGQSYIERDDAIPLYTPELPLRRGVIEPLQGLTIAGCLSDSGPDYWGKRVVAARLRGTIDRTTDLADIGPISYLLESGSNRFGALDFQASPSVYVARGQTASLEDLTDAAYRFEQGHPIPPEVRTAFTDSSGVLGGARPKAAITDRGIQYVAKFQSVQDIGPSVRAEAAAYHLARKVGIDVPNTRLVRAAGRDVLLVERFDRVQGTEARRMAVSALTILELDEMWVREASYAGLAEVMRARFHRPGAAQRELFLRLAFNMCIGNNDDHARNHAAFWDGEMLTLAPAFDLEPRFTGGQSEQAWSQAMAYSLDGQRREANLALLIDSAEAFGLGGVEAHEIVAHCVATIGDEWASAVEVGELPSEQAERMLGTIVLRPSTLTGL